MSTELILLFFALVAYWDLYVVLYAICLALFDAGLIWVVGMAAWVRLGRGE